MFRELSCRPPRIPMTNITRCLRCSHTAWDCARSTCRPTAARAGRTRSGRSCSAISASCARPNCSPAHRIDGAEQYFTRAIDYGYSFDPQEVIEKWGRKEIVGDFVRLIRTFRPDVVLTMNIQGRGGDRAHEATTILVDRSVSSRRAIRRRIRSRSTKVCAVAAEEAVFHGRVRRARRPRWTRRRASSRPECEAGAAEYRDVRSAAGPHLCGDRHRRAQQS